MLFVVGLPVLLPIAGLLQLLFPGILQQQWKQYKYVVHVLLTQSTVIFIHWALCTWVFAKQPWWLGDTYLWAALVVIAAIGAFVAWTNHIREDAIGDEPPPPPTLRRPVSLEFWAVGVLALVGLAWIGWQLKGGTLPWGDWLTVMTIASLVAFLHLLYRKVAWPAEAPAEGFYVTTQRLMLSALVVVGIVLGVYANLGENDRLAAAVTSEWATFRANMDRTGAVLANDPGPKTPKLLWTFNPGVKKGQVTLDSSPTVVDGQVYIGALHTVSSNYIGYLYCINATDGRMIDGKPLGMGGHLWTYDAEGTLQGVFSSPSTTGGRLYFGEGFHQDAKCRLICLDARDHSKLYWTKNTASHVESSPSIVGDRLYFGAGDDGVFCLELPPPKTAEVSKDEPKERWHLEKLHVDSSPTVVGNRVYVGSILGDIYQDFAVFAIDADKGDVVWRVPSPAPIPSSPVVAGDAVYVTLGNGKLNQAADKPIGQVWKLATADGAKKWEFSAAGSIFASPLVKDDRVFAVSTDGYCYCLNAADGKPVWKTYLNRSIVANPILAAGKIYVQPTSGTLYCLDTKTGDIVWTFAEIKSKEDAAYSSPTLVGGRIYTAIDGKVYCVGDGG